MLQTLISNTDGPRKWKIPTIPESTNGYASKNVNVVKATPQAVSDVSW